jgi:hypothetical protein
VYSNVVHIGLGLYTDEGHLCKRFLAVITTNASRQFSANPLHRM